jgi:hypothetical protein
VIPKSWTSLLFVRCNSKGRLRAADEVDAMSLANLREAAVHTRPIEEATPQVLSSGWSPRTSLPKN